MDARTHAALGLSCPDPDTCKHARKREANREHRLEAAQRVARRLGAPYDPALIALYGEPDFDNPARRL